MAHRIDGLPNLQIVDLSMANCWNNQMVYSISPLSNHNIFFYTHYWFLKSQLMVLPCCTHQITKNPVNISISSPLKIQYPFLNIDIISRSSLCNIQKKILLSISTIRHRCRLRPYTVSVSGTACVATVLVCLKNAPVNCCCNSDCIS